MREVLQSLRSASVDLAMVAGTRPSADQLLLRSVASVVSAGAEGMLVDFDGASLLGKGRQQPERVLEVAAKVMTDGLGSTVDALGSGVTGFRVGQLVASNGPSPSWWRFRPLVRPRQCAAWIWPVALVRRWSPPTATRWRPPPGSTPRGVDGVIIAASTPSSKPVHQAATICRGWGRIVLVGVTGSELARRNFYDKEVSCSYGPGRYDPAYEDDAADYPLGFVRCTAARRSYWWSGWARNMAAVRDLAASGRLGLEELITHRFDLDRADDAYRCLREDRSAHGIVLRYPVALGAPEAKAIASNVSIASSRGGRASGPRGGRNHRLAANRRMGGSNDGARLAQYSFDPPAPGGLSNRSSCSASCQARGYPVVTRCYLVTSGVPQLGHHPTPASCGGRAP